MCTLSGSESKIVEEINMQCPYCNEEMKHGYIQSPRHQIFWSEKKRKNYSIFITPSNPDVSLSNGFLSIPAVESYCCQKCKKIIIEFF